MRSSRTRDRRPTDIERKPADNLFTDAGVHFLAIIALPVVDIGRYGIVTATSAALNQLFIKRVCPQWVSLWLALCSSGLNRWRTGAALEAFDVDNGMEIHCRRVPQLGR